jgi:hypothetical protein
MKVVKDVEGRAVFSGSIPAGIGEHDYVCGRCGAAVLTRVGLRASSDAVYECTECKAFNAIRGGADRRRDAATHVCKHD